MKVSVEIHGGADGHLDRLQRLVLWLSGLRAVVHSDTAGCVCFSLNDTGCFSCTFFGTMSEKKQALVDDNFMRLILELKQRKSDWPEFQCLISSIYIFFLNSFYQKRREIKDSSQSTAALNAQTLRAASLLLWWDMLKLFRVFSLCLPDWV